MKRVPVRKADLARVFAAAVAVMYGLGALAVARGPGELTTYAGQSGMGADLVVLAGLALVAGGVTTSLARPGGHTGDLALVAGYVWFAPVWAGWHAGPPLVVSLGTVGAGLTIALLSHVVLASPSGVLVSRTSRVLVLAVYAEAVVAALGLALLRDPFFDPHCWDNCTDNVFLVHSAPDAARAIQDVGLWFTAAAAVALAAICLSRLARASIPVRRSSWPVLAGGVALAGATIAHALLLAGRPVEDPADAGFRSVFVVLCAAALLIGCGLAWTVLQARIQRRSVARIVTQLGEAPPPGSLASALARALRDPELRIAYWLPIARRYVDGHGAPVEAPAPGPGRAVIRLVRDGREVALIAHTAAPAELERELGAAVRLALDNERLQAEVLAQLHDLTASRLRIVETGDAERRRLERDLHDGAQQRLLALSYELRLARAGASAGGEDELALRLGAACDEAAAALDELRELAHGIHPAILTEAGLAPALEALADEAPLAVELRELAPDRRPEPIETTAYLIVAEAIGDAERRGATFLDVRVHDAGEILTVMTEDDGAPREARALHAADRVGALGGALEVGETAVHVELPCA